MCNFLIFIGLIYSSLGIPNEALNISENLKALPETESKIDTLLQTAKILWYSNPDLSIGNAKYAHLLSTKLEDETRQAQALNIIGAGYYFLNAIDSSFFYFNKSYKLSKNLNYLDGIARSSNNLGLVYDYLGHYDQAIDYYYQSLEIEKEKNNKEGIASIYLNIGNIHYSLQEYDKALDYMTNSLRMYQELNNKSGILRCYTNIGTTYSDIGIPRNALTYAEKALKLSRDLEDPDLEISNLNNIGKIHFNQKNYSKALEFYNQSYELAFRYDDNWSKANTLRNIGGIYLEMEDFIRAGTNFKSALDVAEQIQANSLLVELHYDFFKLYEVQNNHSMALSHHKSYTNIKDSLFNAESRGQIARIEASYQLKNKDQQLQIIRQENEVKNLRIKTQQYLIYTFAGLFLCIILFVIFHYFQTSSNRRAKKEIEKNNAQLSEQKILLEETIKKLKESEEKYIALTNSIQEGLIIIQDKKLVYTNKTMCKLMGYNSPEDMFELKPEEVIASEDLARIYRLHEDRLAGKNVPQSYEFSVRHKSGKNIEVSICVTLTNLHGVQTIFGTVKDISGTKRYEQQLIKEKAIAEQATLSKSLFLAGMSHEIRNHLNGIIGIADVLSETKLEIEQVEYVDVIKNSGSILLNIINEILDLSKIEAGQVSLDREIFEVNKVIKEVISLHEINAVKNKLYLVSEIGDKLPKYLEGDPTRLSQVITNLVSNALKFTDKGGITIGVEVLNKTKENIQLKFNIIDSGIGISEESQDKLFKPFSQTHAAVQRKSGGTGLGLVICKKIVNLMNGEIGVDSKLDKGSNFWFIANFRIRKQKIQNKKPKQESDNLSTMQTHNHKILLVEDNLLNQHLTATILGKEGYETDIAMNGQEGFDMFKKKFYNIILMDIQMPVMDGIEATKRIREFEATNYNSKSTIIAVTAHAKVTEKEKLFNAGMNNYLSKPFKAHDLLEMVKTVKNQA